MTTETRPQSALFNFPVLLTLTAILCLVSYQVFGFNTAFGVATGTTVLALCALKGRSKPANAEWN